MIIALILSLNLQAKEWVCEKNQTLECLRINLNEAHKGNTEKFFQIYRDERDKAISCKSEAKVISLLNFYTDVGIDGDIRETVNEDVEKMFIKSPKCGLNTAIKLEPERLKKAAEELREGFVLGDDVKKSLEKFKKDKKYKKFFKFYNLTNK
jgi:hypothetical protein